MSILLAFSGGLDTSFCIPYLGETHREDILAVTVNTGGVRPSEAGELRQRALDLGAVDHLLADGRAELFDDHLAYLIKGNVLRGGVYPLCVGPERVVQARRIIAEARQVGARAVAHGSTGAGNDQVRFDTTLRLLGDDIEVLTPVRDLGLSRRAATDFLSERGFLVPTVTTDYSINRGLWGTTIGGRQTHTTSEPLPEEAYPDTRAPGRAPDSSLTLNISFRDGLPVAIDGQSMRPVELVERLNEVGGNYGVGRGIHVGDTVLGIKGRVGFEAPAAHMLITAHRELEKIVLTKWQRHHKDQLAEFYGMLLHEGQYFDPVMRDIEAFLDASQHVVTGSVTMQLYKGQARVQGCESPFSMMDAGAATYGEEHSMWDGRDARGFARIIGTPAVTAARARGESQYSGALTQLDNE